MIPVLAIKWLSDVLYVLLGLIIGLIIRFFVTKKVFEKQLKENPPINEKMIRVMFKQMGRNPSEKQIREIMRNMNNAK
jgi:uncharacterized protein YneF (UPF0154 family)